MWTTHSTFLPLVTDSWSLPVTANNPIHQVTQKLKRLKVTLKAWNRVTFRNVYVVMEEAVEALNAIQAEAATMGDTEERLLAEIDCNIRLNTTLTQHQALHTQRNRLQWLNDGNRNTKFFHTMNRVRKSSTGLSSLIIDGVLTFDTNSISNAMVEFFSELFTNRDHGSYDDSVLAVTRRVKTVMLHSTGISEGSLPFTYMGVPIFMGAPRSGHQAAMANSIIAKFSKWKGHALSMAGRKCMINSIIASSLVHSMIIYYWPRNLLKRIESAMRNFLWSGDILKKNTSCSVSWSRCCAPIDEGGLGIRSLRLANDSFVYKLAWDILCNESAAFNLIHTRYLTHRGRPKPYIRVSSIWPSICRHLDRLIDGSRWVVGDTSNIRFWNDNWLGYVISDKLGIPSEFADGLVSTIGDFFYDDHWHFDYEFFMKHTDIVKDILKIHISRGTDSRVWGSSVSGLLTSRMAYDLLRASHPRVGWASWIWSSFIPPCRSTLIWRAIWGKLPTADWLIRYGVQGPNICIICQSDSESLDRIFAHCPFSRNLFGKVTNLFDLHLYYDIGFLDVFLQATATHFGKQLSCLWRVAFITTL
ncbi:hypothetical protein ACS0TY_033861 [Phlomoides rotata]